MHYRLKLVLLVVLLSISSLANYAQIAKMQSAFLFQFTRYIEWCSKGASGNFIIAILGRGTALEKELSALYGRNVGNQTIKIQVFSSPADITNCDILFIPRENNGSLAVALDKLHANCALVVTEESGTINKGAGISFEESGGKLNFEINKTLLIKNGMKVSDQLIKLAKRSI